MTYRNKTNQDREKERGIPMGISKYFIILLGLAISCCFVHQAQANGDFGCIADVKNKSKETLLENVDLKYQHIESLQASFSQNSFFIGLGTEKLSSGKIYFRKPGKMDWVYEEPESQRFVSDSTSFWFYQPELKQVTIAEFNKSFKSDLPISFLLGVGQLNKEFRLESVCGTPAGLALDLVPVEDDESLSKFILLVDKENYLPIGARVTDVGGNETSIRFKEISINQTIEDTHFMFSVPKGVDVIDQRERKQGQTPPMAKPEPITAGIKNQ